MRDRSSPQSATGPSSGASGQGARESVREGVRESVTEDGGEVLEGGGSPPLADASDPSPASWRGVQSARMATPAFESAAVVAPLELVREGRRATEADDAQTFIEPG
jgi:hypothetical protein